MDPHFFPLLTKGTYLNTAYVGPLSTSLAKFRSEHEQLYVENGVYYKINSHALLEKTHHSMARFFGLKSERIFAVPNFSIGISQALSFIPKNQKVLLMEEEYPSLAAAFEERDFVIHKISMESEIEIAIEKRLAKNDIDILALSIVQYNTGLLIDIDFLIQLKRKHPNLIIIGDGTQFLGAHSFHFDRSPFDVVVGSGYKWLLAGFGNGVMMVSETFLNHFQLKPQVIFERIFIGHFSILALASLHFAIQSLEEQGFEQLMQKKEALAEQAKHKLGEGKWIGPWVLKRKQHSSIFVLEGAVGLYEHLIQNNINCAQRGKGVRVSFHYYNTKMDLDHLMEVLEQFS
ncbi:aminotransferase class V-fold PLP-dependent enzyme [Flavobacteriaceae bacterium]|nr:aminotransferase class V-fold PLP-dependent enzyme [Flavobacteriaceae bacterium]